jgi:hypothetical protein
MKGQSSQLLMGLPAAGKTTFLAALWYVVQNPSAKSLLQLDHVVGDFKKLNELRECWLRCKPVPRTSLALEATLSMHLKDQVGGKVVLQIPDLAGESFENQWVERASSVTYDKMVQGAQGAIFFINPKRVIPPIRIDMIETIADAFDEDASEEDEEKEPEPSAESQPEWDPHATPTQVKVAELLQFLLQRCPAERPLRVALVVSAWDLVSQLPPITPATWLANELPLLNQFLQSHPTQLDCRVYGLSAQGGQYQDAGADPLCKMDPLSRIVLVGDSVVQKHDLTEPIKWLMS